MTIVRDVVVIPTDPDPASHELPDWETNPPSGWTGTTVDLGNGILVQRLDALAEAVFDACQPAGANYRATRQWGELHSISQEIGAEEHSCQGDNYDVGGELGTVIALSRLIRDNAYCTEFAARVIDVGGRDRQIAPLLSLENRLAYRLSDGRWWLTDAEMSELALLYSDYRAIVLPERVRIALWRCERSTQSRYLGEAVLNSVTGLEALLKVDRHQATHQFVTRVPALARELGLNLHSVSWSDIYGARSDASHGARIALFSPPGWSEGDPPDPSALELVLAAQTVLRSALRRAIENADFASKFASGESVAAAWPL